MRTIGAVLFLGSAVLLGSIALVGRADAGLCKDQAKATFLDCKAQCKADFLDAKFTCRNVQPACGEACLAGRQTCFDNVEQTLDTGIVTGHCSVSTSDGCNADGDCPPNETCVADTTLADTPNGSGGCATGTNKCRDDFQAAKQACHAPCNPNNTATHCIGGANDTAACSADTECPGGVCESCQDCVDTAQIARFSCRDDCRDQFRLNPTVQMEKTSCRSTFKTCVQACPPATP